MKFFLVALLFFYSALSLAKVEVAFIEVRKWDGSLLQLEKNGRFAHVAIRVEGQWLHVHPQRGVELTNNFADIGHITALLADPQAPDITISEVKKFLGLPYDHNYSWTDTHTSYCSKLVGQILGIQPQPMNFDGAAWANQKDLPTGAPGISPDGLFRELLKRGYQDETTSLCVKLKFNTTIAEPISR